MTPELTVRSVNSLATTASNAGAFATEYFERVKRALDDIDVDRIAQIATVLDQARRDGRTIFVAGNGGSATTATSMANDLGFDIVKKTGIDLPFRFLAVTDNTAAITAIANDVGYEDIFVNQIRIHYRPGDLLIVISASGNSPNAIRAAEWVKAAGGMVIALLGFTGGMLMGLSDIVLHVPTEAGEYGPVEDAHLIVNHVLAHWFQARLSAS